MSKDRLYNKLIQSRKWLELRRRKINNNPLCERCAEIGLIVPVAEIHHKRPCEESMTPQELERLMYDYNNLQSLCHDCHVEVHKQAKSKTKEFVAERREKANARFIERYFGDPSISITSPHSYTAHISCTTSISVRRTTTPLLTMVVNFCIYTTSSYHSNKLNCTGLMLLFATDSGVSFFSVCLNSGDGLCGSFLMGG